jgi:hypothetical protein
MFEEDQIMLRSHRWLLALIGLPVAVVWYGFIQQIVLGRPFGNNPGPDWLMWALALSYGLGLPALITALRLRVQVDAAGVLVRYHPFLVRRIGFAEIRSCAAARYRPILDYGGWGVRWSPTRGWVYSVAGDQGVLLQLRNGRSLMIGTRRAEELAAAIRAVLPPAV